MKTEKKTHKDEVRLLHGPSGRRRASLFFVRCATSVEAIPFLRAPNSARSASYRQRCSTCHRVQAAPSNEGRIEEPVQPFFEDRSRSSVSLYIYIRHTWLLTLLRGAVYTSPPTIEYLREYHVTVSMRPSQRSRQLRVSVLTTLRYDDTIARERTRSSDDQQIDARI